MTHRLVLFAFVCSAAACTLTGCGRGISAPRTAPVTGKVLYKGKPLAGVHVTFHPKFDVGRVKFTPSGVTDKDGVFRLSTAAPGDGAPPGEYAVTLTYPVIQSDRKNSGIEVEVDYFKGRYNDPSASKWPIRVNKGGNELDPFLVD